MGSDGYLDSWLRAALNGTPTSDGTCTFPALVQPVLVVVAEAEGRNIIDASGGYLVQGCQATHLRRPDCLRDNALGFVELRSIDRDS